MFILTYKHPHTHKLCEYQVARRTADVKEFEFEVIDQSAGTLCNVEALACMHLIVEALACMHLIVALILSAKAGALILLPTFRITCDDWHLRLAHK
jgi:hypothetical protein